MKVIKKSKIRLGEILLLHRLGNFAIQLISGLFTFDFLFSLLYWKISKIHYLKETGSCKLCKSYFDLRNEIEAKIKP